MRIRLAKKVATRLGRYPRHMVRRARERLGPRRFVALLARARGLRQWTWRSAGFVVVR